MAKFVLTFEDARQPSSPEAGQKHMSDYKDWLAGLGDTLVMPQLAFRQTRVVTDQGVREAGPGGIMGFLMIEAENMDAAIALPGSAPSWRWEPCAWPRRWMSRPSRLNSHRRLHHP